MLYVLGLCSFPHSLYYCKLFCNILFSLVASNLWPQNSHRQEIKRSKTKIESVYMQHTCIHTYTVNSHYL